jgi:uncharacterized membrane protein YhaH (DUF805 family)
MDAWFYTANGERLGPLSKESLRELAAAGQLHPRLDLCWTQGMGEWLPAGEIDGLFEKKSSAKTQESLAADASSVRQAQPTHKLSESELELQLLNAEWPGATRRVYLFVIWVLPFIMGAAVAGLSHFLLDPDDPSSEGVLSLVSTSVGVVLIGMVFYVSLLRFQNLGMSGWWILGNLVPLLNLWVGYRSICCPAGYEYHRKLDGIGKLLTVLYFGMFVLVIGVMVLAVLLLLGIVGGGAIGDLETLFQKIHDPSNPGEGASPEGE